MEQCIPKRPVKLISAEPNKQLWPVLKQMTRWRTQSSTESANSMFQALNISHDGCGKNRASYHVRTIADGMAAYHMNWWLDTWQFQVIIHSAWSRVFIWEENLLSRFDETPGSPLQHLQWKSSFSWISDKHANSVQFRRITVLQINSYVSICFTFLLARKSIKDLKMEGKIKVRWSLWCRTLYLLTTGKS